MFVRGDAAGSPGVGDRSSLPKGILAVPVSANAAALISSSLTAKIPRPIWKSVTPAARTIDSRSDDGPLATRLEATSPWNAGVERRLSSAPLAALAKANPAQESSFQDCPGSVVFQSPKPAALCWYGLFESLASARSEQTSSSPLYEQPRQARLPCWVDCTARSRHLPGSYILIEMSPATLRSSETHMQISACFVAGSSIEEFVQEFPFHVVVGAPAEASRRRRPMFLS